jgi:malonate transporter and related proteins
MLAIFNITLPFFALVAIGYLAARMKWMPESVVPGLNTFVLYFALPCMLFRFAMATPIAQLLNPALLGVWLVAALAIVGFVIGSTRSVHIDGKNASFGALVAAFPNTGFLGVPLLTKLLGAAAAGPLVCALLVDIFVTSSLCIALAQATTSHGAHWRSAFATAARGAALNPLPWAIALGAAFGASGWVMPSPIDTLLRMLGDAATPVSLFAIGAVLYVSGQHAATRTPPSRYLPVAMVKLLLHPLLVFTLGMGAQHMGWITLQQNLVLTMAAALPSASSVSMLAERYGADNGRVARIIMSSTVLSFLSVSLLAVWVQDAF